MNTAYLMHIPFDTQFDVALEAIMLEEEQSRKRLTLVDHPVYGMLFESADEFTALPIYGVKMTSPVNHTPEVNIVTRVKAVASLFDSTLSATEWQSVCDQHPAAPFIIAEIQNCVNTAQYLELTQLMDRLDGVGFLTSFDRSSLVFSITFKEHADIRLTDAQNDFKNKRLLEVVNGVDPMDNPKGGWTDNKPSHSRVHPWSFTLNPALPIEGDYRRSVPTIDGEGVVMIHRRILPSGWDLSARPITTPRNRI